MRFHRRRGDGVGFVAIRLRLNRQWPGLLPTPVTFQHHGGKPKVARNQ